MIIPQPARDITSAIYVLPKTDYFCEGPRGRVTHAIGVANGLSRNGLGVAIISGPGLAGFKPQLDKGVELIEIPKTFKKNTIVGEISWQMRLFRLVKRRLRREEDPVIITRYGPRSMFLQILLATGLSTHRLVTAEVNSLAFHQLLFLPAQTRRILLKLELLVLALFDEIHVVSGQLKRDVEGTGFEKPITVVSNASDPRNDFVKEGDPDNDELRFIYLGQFHRYYNFPFFLRALSIMGSSGNKVELHIWGNGRFRSEIQIPESLTSRIVLHGPYGLRDVVGSLNRASDVFILPCKPGSRAEITSPIKLFEYMSLGIPIVASDVGQVSEILQHRVTGYLYDPFDLNSLQNLLSHVAKNREERVSVGKRARKELESHHTWEKRMGLFIRELNLVKRGDTHGTGLIT